MFRWELKLKAAFFTLRLFSIPTFVPSRHNLIFSSRPSADITLGSIMSYIVFDIIYSHWALVTCGAYFSLAHLLLQNSSASLIHSSGDKLQYRFQDSFRSFFSNANCFLISSLSPSPPKLLFSNIPFSRSNLP